MSDFTYQLEYPGTSEAWHTKLRVGIADMRSEGATFFRVTEFPEHNVGVLEGWLVQPEDQGPAPEPWLEPA